MILRGVGCILVKNLNQVNKSYDVAQLRLFKNSSGIVFKCYMSNNLRTGDIAQVMFAFNILTLLSIVLVMQLLSKFFVFQVRWLQLQQSVKSSGKHYQTSMFLNKESTTATDQVLLLLVCQQFIPITDFLGCLLKNLKVQNNCFVLVFFEQQDYCLTCTAKIEIRFVSICLPSTSKSGLALFLCPEFTCPICQMLASKNKLLSAEPLQTQMLRAVAMLLELMLLFTKCF